MIRSAHSVSPWIFLLVSSAAGALEPGSQRDGAIGFNADIRPILSTRCFACHGPDASKRKGGRKGGPALRLDTDAALRIELSGRRRAIVPGRPGESELIARIGSNDDDERMPPPEKGPKLTARDADRLKRWIAAGARYEKHWSFEKPHRPPPPAVRRVDRPVNPIDRFILARLEREGIAPSPRADRYAVARRAALDLTGLPPSLDQVDRFVNDGSPKAYEAYVDRLLGSPAYGERWAAVWLDLARFADSAGYANDPPRTIWGYRDWVIRAINDNMPFDRFTIEQIAGDMLPDASVSQIQATAFHRNTVTNSEGGTDDEEFRNVAVVDRVNTTMQVWMGLTIGCAQCHDHKFDPVSQEEYFRLFAIFNNTEDADRQDERPLLKVYSPRQETERRDLAQQIAALEAALGKTTAALDTGARRWAETVKRPVRWQAARPGSIRSAGGAQAKTLEDGSTLLSGKSPKTDTLTLKFRSDGGTVTGLRIDALPHPSLPKGGPGRHADGNFVLSRVDARLTPARKAGLRGRFVRVKLPGRKKILSLAEVQVFSGGVNVARKGKATQSSTAYEGPPRLAVDGNTDGHYFNAKSTTHTNTENNPWWQVDLGRELPIERIVLWNRTDSASVGERLKGFRVLVLDSGGKSLWQTAGGKVPRPNSSFTLDGGRDIRFAAAGADYSQDKFPADAVLNNQDLKNRGWAVAPRSGRPHWIALATDGPVSLARGDELTVTLRFQSQWPGASIGRFRISLTDDPFIAAKVSLPAPVAAILKMAASDRSASDRKTLRDYYADFAPELKEPRDRIASLKRKQESMKPSVSVPIMRERPAGKRRKTHIHIRGNFLNKGKAVTEGVPGAFHPLPAGRSADRLGLAHWLVDPDNALTARVIANRYWEQIFGTGLVRTSEDFGTQGELPSHPALLDWLATELVRLGWDTKAFVRILVTSASYRQSSAVTPERIARDPYNLLLGRGPRFRLSAEMVRDQALFVSGLLSRKMYGPSVQPPRPNMGLKAAFGGSTDWKTSPGEDKFRRGLYTSWRRTIPYPSMATFDATAREVCTIRRIRTNTPLQALVTMNDPVYVEAAQALARRIVAGGGADTAARVVYGFRLCLARPAKPAERDRLLALHRTVRARYAADRAAAEKMATVPIGPPPKGTDVIELAAWTVVANVLLNLDETIFKR